MGAPPTPAARFGGRYVIERSLGEGSSAKVFLARDTSRGIAVAIKILRAELTDSSAAQRFLKEIRRTSALQHSRIVPVLDSGEWEGQLYFTLPYMEGGTLRTLLKREKNLEFNRVLDISRPIAEALDYAHQRGLVHRDVKPENILFTGVQACLADFGIARALDVSGAIADTSTSKNTVRGTAAYMSPEQAAGATDLDGRSDVYSLACVIYEMITGMQAFIGPTSEAVIAQRFAYTPREMRVYRPTAPPTLDSVLITAFAVSPADRYRTASDLVAAVEGAVTSAAAAPMIDHRRAASDTSDTARDGVQGPVQESRIQVGPPTLWRRLWRQSFARVGSLRPSRRAAMLRLVVLAALAVWLLYAGRTAINRWFRRSRIPSDPTLIVIAPFSVLDPGLAIWREGLVDMLSRNIDGSGPLRAVSPSAVISQWRGRADMASVIQLGLKTGARYGVYGMLVRSGKDSIRLSASVVDVLTNKDLGDVEIAEASEHMDRAADRVAVGVLDELSQIGGGQFREVRLSRNIPSFSLPVLKAFLAGEHYFRLAIWDSALAQYRHVIELAPTHALALFRLSLVARQAIRGDSLSAAYAKRADEFNRGLTPRESLMVHAAALSAKISSVFADTTFWTDRAEFFSTLDHGIRSYPEESELWYILAETLYRHGGTFRRTLNAYDRVLAIDPGFAPAYDNAIVMAMGLSGPASARRYLDAYLALRPADVHTDGLRLAARLLDLRTSQSAETRAMLDSAGADMLEDVLGVVGYWPDSSETMIRLARLSDAKRRNGAPGFPDSMYTKYQLARSLAFRGHLRAAMELLGTRPQAGYVPALWAALIEMMGGTPADQAAQFFSRLASQPIERPTGLVIALPWWASSRDSVSLVNVARRANAVDWPRKNAVERAYVRYVASAAQAYLALARLDTTKALERLLTLPDSSCMFPYCPLEPLIAAQLLAARGEYVRAGAILEDVPNSHEPVNVLWRFRKAQVMEHLGRGETATEGYRFVVDAWSRADSVLQPYVREAQRALRRLEARR